MQFMLGDHILYSYDFSDCKGVDMTKRNLTLITIEAYRDNVSYHQGESGNRTEIRQKTANRIGFFPEYKTLGSHL